MDCHIPLRTSGSRQRDNQNTHMHIGPLEEKSCIAPFLHSRISFKAQSASPLICLQKNAKKLRDEQPCHPFVRL